MDNIKNMAIKQQVMLYFKQMFTIFGRQNWWPAETPFEVILGAILTQNTTWKNVEKCIRRLRDKNILDPYRLYKVDLSVLADLIRSSGYFNQKAKKLKSFLNFFHEHYNLSIELMRKEPTDIMRNKLLGLYGIGPETADSILLYALNKPVFVVDAYTRRIFSRHGLIDPHSDYEAIRSFFETNLEQDILLFNEYHALIVAVGKNYCGTRARCDGCPLCSFLPDTCPVRFDDDVKKVRNR